MLDMEIRMWILDFISRTMNILKDNNTERMVHSDLDCAKITLAVVIYKIVSRRKTWLIIMNFGTPKQASDNYFPVDRDLGLSGMISGTLVLKILATELSSEGIYPNTMSITKKTAS